jgi:hypothetical protein
MRHRPRHHHGDEPQVVQGILVAELGDRLGSAFLEIHDQRGEEAFEETSLRGARPAEPPAQGGGPPFGLLAIVGQHDVIWLIGHISSTPGTRVRTGAEGARRSGKIGSFRERSGERGRKFRTCLSLYVSLGPLSSEKCQFGHFSFVNGHTAANAAPNAMRPLPLATFSFRQEPHTGANRNRMRAVLSRHMHSLSPYSRGGSQYLPISQYLPMEVSYETRWI